MRSRSQSMRMERLSSADALIIEDLRQHKLAARHLVASLERAGWRTQLVDLNDGVDTIIQLAQRSTPRLIVSSILFADCVNEHLALMTALRKAGSCAHLSTV